MKKETPVQAFSLSAILALFGLAEYAGQIEAFLELVPAWIQAASLFITAFAAIAALTPTPKDNIWAKRLRAIVDVLALRFDTKPKDD